MFGVGLGEAAVIALIAVLVFGPERLPEFARQAGRMLRTLRLFATSARDELRTELGPEFSDLELRDLDPRAIVRKHIIEAMEEADEEEAEKAGTSSAAKPSRRRRPPLLAAGETPPYDPEAT